MQTESTNSKKILISGIVAVVIIFIVYYVFFRTTAPVVTYDEFGNPIVAEVVGQDLIDLSAQLETVTFNPETLRKKTFTNLVDHSVALPTDPVGRRNPFSPVGSTGGASGGVSDAEYDALVAEIIRNL